MIVNARRHASVQRQNASLLIYNERGTLLSVIIFSNLPIKYFRYVTFLLYLQLGDHCSGIFARGSLRPESNFKGSFTVKRLRITGL